MSDPSVVRSTTVHSGYLRVERLDLASPDGSTFSREVVRHGTAVVVVPWDGERVHLIEQFRAAVGRRLIELPAGMVDEGETPEAAAHRELCEESGFRAEAMTLLHRVHPSPGYTDEEVCVFLAEGLSEVVSAPAGPEEESMEHLSWTPTEVRRQMATVENALSVLGLYALLLRLES